MQGAVAGRNEHLGDNQRERVVYKEPQTRNGASNEWDLPLPDGFRSVA